MHVEITHRRSDSIQCPEPHAGQGNPSSRWRTCRRTPTRCRLSRCTKGRRSSSWEQLRTPPMASTGESIDRKVFFQMDFDFYLLFIMCVYIYVLFIYIPIACSSRRRRPRSGPGWKPSSQRTIFWSVPRVSAGRRRTAWSLSCAHPRIPCIYCRNCTDCSTRWTFFDTGCWRNCPSCRPDRPEGSTNHQIERKTLLLFSDL